ncbi:hypothetical protein ACTOB_004227 [Actinoplanes oblitus]|uniref:YrhK domain-containing protein n=1 Tax=Actinoplanes oblitus TaxID=3040509 RepID=A0ABY8WVH5_9ACTN|nr:hypothetical protein [Actinoplanes oblitus]WIN00515.1 hypothetical protein ACTOB_004227 [Actinoplanes oblitus]
MDATRYPTTPAEWSTARHRHVGPFLTHVTYRRSDGRTVVWSSRGHRKHASRLSGASWWIAVLFAAGSLCFLVAPLPAFLRLAGPAADGTVFFVGSLLFTSAAGLQWLETINTSRAPGRPAAGHRWRLLTFEPRRIDWWSCGLQLAGTLFFNVTTFRALSVGLDSPGYDRLVWRPDALGSLCFLLSGYLAYAEVTGHLLALPDRTLESAIAGVNLLGCLAFAAAAVASYVIPSAGSERGPAVVNTGTALGALCFLVGALLLFPESGRKPAAERA